MLTEVRCWFHGCDAPGRAERLVYRERGGEIPLTLCGGHAAVVATALGDREARWGVLVTSHEPSRVLLEDPPRRRNTRRYRALIVIHEPGVWPTVELRQSAMSRRTIDYEPAPPFMPVLGRDEGVKYELLEVSPEEAIGDFGVPWPKSLIIERRHAGYTDRQLYIPTDPLGI